jgi:hypothetical protein
MTVLTPAQQKQINKLKQDAQSYNQDTTVNVDGHKDGSVTATTATRSLLIRENGTIEPSFGSPHAEKRPAKKAAKTHKTSGTSKAKS